MFFLDTTAPTKLIRAKLSGAPATTNPYFEVAYADKVSSVLTEKPDVGQLNGTTYVTLVAAPSSGTRIVKTVNVYNSDTAAVTITFEMYNGTTGYVIATVTLQVGESYELCSGVISGTSTKSANTVYAGPASGAAAPPTFRSLVVADLPSNLFNSSCDGRLTLESGVPVSSTDQTAKTTVYFTPYKGNRVAIYNGSSWVLLSFVETSIALGTLTIDKNYDVFAYSNGGTVALELSAAWNSATARFGSGPYAALLPTQDGVYVKSTDGTVIDNTRRYLGTFYTTATTTTEDSVLKRLLWNYYNRVPRPLAVTDATATWSLGPNVWRQARATATNQVEVTCGINQSMIELVVQSYSTNSGIGYRAVGIGENSTTVAHHQTCAGTSATDGVFASATLRKNPRTGWSRYVWLEFVLANTVTFYGNAGFTLDEMRCGMAGSIDN